MIRSLGIVIWFLMTQIISCWGVFTVKALTDYDWLDQLANAGDIFSAEYMLLVNEVLYPALLLSDFLIVMPILLKKKEPFCKKINTGSFFYYISMGLLLNLVVSVIVDVLPTKNYDSLMSVILTGSPVLIFILNGIIAPIVEEIVFRYKLIDILENKYNPRVALILSSLLFGLAHMNIVQSTYAFFLGIVLGSIYLRKDKNLLPCIIVHIAINASSILYEQGIISHLFGVLLGS